MCPLPFAGVCKGRAAAGIIVCPQQKPWTKQVERFCSLHLYLPQLFLINFCVQGMAVFATPSWQSPISGLPPFPVRYLGERCASTTAKTKYLLYEINLPICTYSGDFWWRDSWTASPSPSSSSPVNQHHEGLLWSLTSLQPGYQYQMIQITLSYYSSLFVLSFELNEVNILKCMPQVKAAPFFCQWCFKQEREKSAEWNVKKTFVPRTTEYLPFIQNVWSHA